jgi:ABC-type transporter Mla MlaB component
MSNEPVTKSHEAIAKYVKIRLDHGVLVVQLQRPVLTDPMAVEELWHYVRGHLPRATRGVLVDCSSMNYHVTSQFLAMLVRIQKAVRQEGMNVAVCGLRGPLREAFEITKLEQIIPVFAKPEEMIEQVGDFSTGEMQVELAIRQAVRHRNASDRAEAASRDAKGVNRWLGGLSPGDSGNHLPLLLACFVAGILGTLVVTTATTCSTAPRRVPAQRSYDFHPAPSAKDAPPAAPSASIAARP